MSTNAAGNRLEMETAVKVGGQKREKNDPAGHAAVNACPRGPIASIPGILIGRRLTRENESEELIEYKKGAAPRPGKHMRNNLKHEGNNEVPR